MDRVSGCGVACEFEPGIGGATEPLISRRRLRSIGQREPDSRALGMRKVPPPAGQATGHTPGVGDGWLWNSNDTPHPDP